MSGGDAAPTPAADESTAVAANMAGDAVGEPAATDPDLAGEPGTMDEREVAGRRGRDEDQASDEAP
ncbi:MAG: hypothetical protein KY461_14290 [Actinobacteria bacterium]|nr:hypothetical protein [Actinomycetota bacterium]